MPSTSLLLAAFAAALAVAASSLAAQTRPAPDATSPQVFEEGPGRLRTGMEGLDSTDLNRYTAPQSTSPAQPRQSTDDPLGPGLPEATPGGGSVPAPSPATGNDTPRRSPRRLESYLPDLPAIPPRVLLPLAGMAGGAVMVLVLALFGRKTR